MSDVQTADAGPLSIDQAAGLLSAAPAVVEQEAPESADDGEPDAEDPEIESEADPAAEDDAEPEDPAIGDDEEAEPESEPELPAIAAPVSWDDAHKARFKELPRDVQEFLVKREGERDTATFQALQTAAEGRKQIDVEANRVKALADRLDQLLPQAVQTFQSKWGDGQIDWVAVFDERGSEETNRLKLQYEADMAELQRVAHAQQQAAEETAKQAQATLVAEREVGLRTAAPALCDPVEGTRRRDELAGWLLQSGFSKEDIITSNAIQLGIAWKAYQHDVGAASLKAATDKSKPLPTLKPAAQAKTSVPSAAPPAPPRQRTLETARANLNRTGSVDDAVAELLAKQRLRK